MAVIGIMDSGIGGLSVYRQIAKILPNERYLYFADSANCPYGEKSHEFICERSHIIVSKMIQKGADAAVIACNTATAAAIKTLREEFSIPILGIEPAVKPAASLTRSGVIGVLATASTLQATKYHKTKSLYEDKVRFSEGVGRGFVEEVEAAFAKMSLDFPPSEAFFDAIYKELLSSPSAEEVVKLALQPLMEAGADTIVLGCTHYPFLLPVMKKIASENIKFLDPAPAVAKHLRTVLLERGIILGETKPSFEFFSSSRPEYEGI